MRMVKVSGIHIAFFETLMLVLIHMLYANLPEVWFIYLMFLSKQSNLRHRRNAPLRNERKRKQEISPVSQLISQPTPSLCICIPPLNSEC